MENKDIIDQLKQVHLENFPFEEINREIQAQKLVYVNGKLDEKAKLLWIYETIIAIHKLYQSAFNLLKEKSYYNAWCSLDDIEIRIGQLKKHFSYDKTEYFLWHIEKSVKNIQVIYPYTLFISTEILIKKEKCSVCNNLISIRNPCGHYINEIYNGEICSRIVVESELMGTSIVENPGNKYSVLFLNNEDTNKEIDHYKYDAIDYFIDLVDSPYEIWDLEVTLNKIRKEDYGNISRNDFCCCNSGKKFKKCCMIKIGQTYPNYEFLVKNPAKKPLLLMH